MPATRKRAAPRQQALGDIALLLLGQREKLWQLSRQMKELEKQMTEIQDSLTQLKADVTALTTVEQSAVALLNGLTAQILAIINAGGDPTQTLSDIKDVIAGVEGDTSDLAAAVAANTPAAPAQARRK